MSMEKGLYYDINNLLLKERVIWVDKLEIVGHERVQPDRLGE